MMDKKQIGKKLRALRMERGLRMKDAADRAGVGINTIGNAELGKVHLTLPVFCALLQLYGFEVTTRNYGTKLRSARKKAGMTQERLASKAGLTEPQLSHYERETYYPRLAKHFDLCECLGEDPIHFLVG